MPKLSGFGGKILVIMGIALCYDRVSLGHFDTEVLDSFYFLGVISH